MIDIPAGKKVRIRTYNITANVSARTRGKKIEDLNDQTFVLAEPFRLDVSSEFGNLLTYSDSKVGEALTLVSNLAKGISGGSNNLTALISGQTEYQNFQIWKNTNPVKSKFTMNVVSQGDPDKDVIAPIKALMKTVVPKSSTNSALKTFTPPGPSITSQLKRWNPTKYESVSDASDVTDFTLILGNYVINHVIFTGVTPTFVHEYDANGKPLSVSVEVSFTVDRTPTDTTIDDFFGGFSEEVIEKV